jgi:asparagine synthetase B (glutamine-hydrolysing)
LPREAFDLSLHSSSVRQLELELYESLKLRVLNIPSPPVPVAIEVKFAVLFSGGLDCTVLARIAHDIVPTDQRIDLLNVAFENPRVIQAARQGPGATDRVNQDSQNQKAIDGIYEVPLLTETCEMNPSTVAASDPKWAYESCPDRITGRNALRELQQVCPGRKWNFVAVIAT